MANDSKQTQVWLGFLAGALFLLAGILNAVTASRKGHSIWGGIVLGLVGLFWAVMAAGWKKKAD